MSAPLQVIDGGVAHDTVEARIWKGDVAHVARLDLHSVFDTRRPQVRERIRLAVAVDVVGAEIVERDDPALRAGERNHDRGAPGAKFELGRGPRSFILTTVRITTKPAAAQIASAALAMPTPPGRSSAPEAVARPPKATAGSSWPQVQNRLYPKSKLPIPLVFFVSSCAVSVTGKRFSFISE